MDNNDNKTYLDRMHEEETQLKERIDKLSTFITQNNKFKGLPLQKRQLLIHQLDAMKLYEYFLAKRIALEHLEP